MPRNPVNQHPHSKLREDTISGIIFLLTRGGAVWQLVGLITRRSQVQILSPQPNFNGSLAHAIGPFWF